MIGDLTGCPKTLDLRELFSSLLTVPTKMTIADLDRAPVTA